MFSVTNTGLNTLPLCTVNVRPTNSGVMVERRDQVLIGYSGVIQPLAVSPPTYPGGAEPRGFRYYADRHTR